MNLLKQSASAELQILRPLRAGAIRLANRVVMAPLTRARITPDGVPGTEQAIYYAQRASSGLIISEATNISPQARGFAMTPGIWTQEQVEGWRAVTDAVHSAGGKIVCQLWHVGRNSHVNLQPKGAAPVGPSALRAAGAAYTESGPMKYSMPRALERDEIPGIIGQYRHAAVCAMQAGFDGVEIHAGNGYLLEQFIRDSTNHRIDDYGGNIANRVRLTLEVTKAICEVWDSDRVAIRLSPVNKQPADTPLDSEVMATYGYLIEQLNGFNLAYLHFVEGSIAVTREDPSGVDLDILRSRFKGTFIGNNGYDLPLAERRIKEGCIDAVAFGRAFIGNPDLVYRLKTGMPLVQAPPASFYGGGAQGYTDWPVG